MRWALPVLIAACTAGCGSRVSDSHILVSIDKSNPEQLLRFYFGGYVKPEPADPFDAGLLLEEGGRIYLNQDSLEKHFSGSRAALTDADGNEQIDWPELERFIEETYYAARSLPQTAAALRAEMGRSDRMTVDVHGAMTSARRRISVSREAVREALERYESNGKRILYPDATTIVGEHYLSDSLAETTVMRKRSDGFWDFFVYAADGTLAGRTATPPKELRAPVQCVGCHFGSKLFEPEKSFPGEAEPGPDGPRRLYVEDALRDPRITEFFDEHEKRSDSILGLYATIFVAQLRSEQRAGRISPVDESLLDELEIN